MRQDIDVYRIKSSQTINGKVYESSIQLYGADESASV